MGYSGQSKEDGIYLLAGEIPDQVFTEKVRRAAYTDIEKEKFDSLPELKKLQEAGSHQARVHRGMVACGVAVQVSETGIVLNYDELHVHLQGTQVDNPIIASHIAAVMGLPNGCLEGDGR